MTEKYTENKNSKDNNRHNDTNYVEMGHIDDDAIEGLEINDDFDPQKAEIRKKILKVDEKSKETIVSESKVNDYSNKDVILEKKVDEKENIVLKIPQDISSKLPDDFNINEIGSIDLREAEKIASEDILFLTEDDLIEGLEDLDLIPLKDDDSSSSSLDIDSVTDQSVTSQDEIDVAASQGEVRDQEVEKENLSVETIDFDEDDDIETIVFGEDGDEINEKTSENIELKDSYVKEEPTDDSVIKENIVESEPLHEKSEPHQEIISVTPESEVRHEDALPSNNIELRDEKVDENFNIDTSNSEVLQEENAGFIDNEINKDEAKSSNIDGHEENIFDTENDSLQQNELNDLSKEKTDATGQATDVFAFIDEDFGHVPSSTPIPQSKDVDIEKTEVVVNDIIEETEISESSQDLSNITHRDFEIIKEELPESLQALEMVNSRVKFIDDEGIEKPVVELLSLFEEGDLERIDSNIVEIAEGNVTFLKEGGDKWKRTLLDASKKDEILKDILIDFDDDYYYTDTDIDFIHSAIIEDDYSEYIRSIDTLYNDDSAEKMSSAVELLGLSDDDIDEINNRLFTEEYESVDLDSLYDQLVEDILGPATYHENRICNYILPENDSITEEEKLSIEEDLSASNALIFEEDIAEIISNLKSQIDGTDVVKVDIKVVDEVLDITNDIVIIEDEIDVDRFIQDISEDKQDSMKKLFTYLDGLFEKLPEKTIKNFADSEYFDLYVKILNEMGL